VREVESGEYRQWIDKNYSGRAAGEGTA
jgi:hypothetical protein